MTGRRTGRHHRTGWPAPAATPAPGVPGRARFAPRFQPSGHRRGQPVARLLAGRGTGQTAAGTRQSRRRGGPGASAARTRRSAPMTAMRRSPGPLPPARRLPRLLPGSPYCPPPADPRQEPATPASPGPGQQHGRGCDNHAVHRQRSERRYPARLAMQFHQQVHVQAGHSPRDQRQHPDASDRGPPDPPVRPPGHASSPASTNTPDSDHWL
jgi:hypothetical protein